MIKEARIVSIFSLFPIPQYVVILEDMAKTRLVPIWIGPSEGSAIALEMQGEKFPRPLTHDLMANIFSELGVKVEKVIVSDIRDGSYYAIMVLQQGDKKFEIDARPSDSLALAVRVKCPVYIDEKVLAKCPSIDGPITQEEVEKFKNDLKNMTPEEFFKDLEKSNEEESGFGGPEESEGSQGGDPDDDPDKGKF